MERILAPLKEHGRGPGLGPAGPAGAAGRVLVPRSPQCWAPGHSGGVARGRAASRGRRPGGLGGAEGRFRQGPWGRLPPKRHAAPRVGTGRGGTSVVTARATGWADISLWAASRTGLPAGPTCSALGRRPGLLLAWRTGRLTHSGLAEGQVLAEATCPHARPLRQALTLRPCPLRGTSRTDSHLQCGLFLGPSAPRPRYCSLGNGNRGSCCRPRATCTAQAQGTRQGQEPRWPQKHAGQAVAGGLGRGGRPGPAPQCSHCGSRLSLLAWRAARWGPRRPR